MPTARIERPEYSTLASGGASAAGSIGRSVFLGNTGTRLVDHRNVPYNGLVNQLRYFGRVALGQKRVLPRARRVVVRPIAALIEPGG